MPAIDGFDRSYIPGNVRFCQVLIFAMLGFSRAAGLLYISEKVNCHYFRDCQI